jgi:hypothetical protein
MILTVQLAGIGLMMAPAPADLVTLPDAAQASAAPTPPLTRRRPPRPATPPIIDPAATPAPETPRRKRLRPRQRLRPPPAAIAARSMPRAIR